jgi:hypothetical protein
LKGKAIDFSVLIWMADNFMRKIKLGEMENAMQRWAYGGRHVLHNRLEKLHDSHILNIEQEEIKERSGMIVF